MNIRKKSAINAPHPIDFVVAWVDGSDPAWRAERDAWQEREGNHPWSEWATGDLRFRDWGLLPYWFRGVETFAPWVRRVHFVTWGHVPSWLNTEHPKLNVVRHEDFISSEYLPTFNASAIELNLHRIEGLAEHFVYFNDDMFLTRPVEPEQFFKSGLPRDFAGLDACVPQYGRTDPKPANTAVINRLFNKRKAMLAHPFKWLNLRYGPKALAKTIFSLPYNAFTGMQINHLAYNLRKSSFDEIWTVAHDDLDQTCQQRFRRPSGCNIWLVQDWARCKGEFVPAAPELGAWLDPRLMASRLNANRLVREIATGRWHQVSVNDECTSVDDFAFWSAVTKRAFEQLLPEPCSFERI